MISALHKPRWGTAETRGEVWGVGGRTVADPVAGAGEPLGVARGVGVDEEARLLAAVAQGAEGVVAVAAAAAVPVALPPPAAARAARRGSRAGHRSARARAPVLAPAVGIGGVGWWRR